MSTTSSDRTCSMAERIEQNAPVLFIPSLKIEARKSLLAINLLYLLGFIYALLFLNQNNIINSKINCNNNIIKSKIFVYS